MLTLQQKRALFALGVYTAWRFDVWALAGSCKAGCRAHILSELAGKRVPQSQSGVNALRAALYEVTNPDGACEAAREESFRSWCHAQKLRHQFATLADVK